MTELKKILYVEDDADIQKIAKMALEMVGGFTVQACSSGQEALACAEEFAPDMILLDVMMPDMDGPTTLKHLRERPSLAKVPVAFMTAKIQPQEVQEYKALGALEVISKPFQPMTLADQIRAVWAQKPG